MTSMPAAQPPWVAEQHEVCSCELTEFIFFPELLNFIQLLEVVAEYC